MKRAAARALLEAPVFPAIRDIVAEEAQALADMRRVALRIEKSEGDTVERHLRAFHEDAETLARLVLAYTGIDDVEDPD